MLNVIDVLSKYAWSVPLKDKTAESVKSAFENIIKTSERTPNHLWVDEGTEFYNRVLKKFLNEHNINMYSTYGESKSVVVERFNRTLKTNMWKQFTVNNTRNWINMLPMLLKKYNESTHSSIGMSPINASKNENERKILDKLYDNKVVLKPPKFEVGDTVRISRVKGLFEKGYLPNWSEQIYKIIEVKQTNPVTYIIADLKDEIIKGSFYEQELQKTDQQVYRIEKVLRKKKINGKQFGLVKWVGYNNDFNEWLPMSQISQI